MHEVHPARSRKTRASDGHRRGHTPGQDGGRVPDTVRLYAFSPSSITIGRFQSVRHDVNLEEARRLGIPVVRRITGGGSVFHDEFGGEITYSVVIGEDYHPALRNVEESYRYLAGPLVDALEELGLDAGFSGLNDIVANGKKISGSAQTRRKGVILQHGTFMYSTRLEVLARVLRVSKAKLSDKGGVSSIWERVTTLEREGGIKMNRWEAYELLKEKFSAAFGPEEGGTDRLRARTRGEAGGGEVREPPRVE